MTTKRTSPVDPAEIVYVSGTGSFVPSASAPGSFWLVTYDGRKLECGCPAGRKAAEAGPRARACRHMLGVVARVKAEDERHRRPWAPPNVSALVD